ncbi:single-stranded-DNA-specific exonuclease RecJ [Natroniella sulfidigena]|uniref:single-stranded-DNA-specific exonuclease RecJ n=1 Tax=Natroniella sulfidigena TaxID=723921 RepID=UPI002009FFB4|nr:single-stranded-DNA-specific exonuclease RecJ [Natroniella sulfidigena]MCK8816893.1 single-stranded-DNA-specific exonuclease RecJ [Natroniella sulfidigena]
MDLKVDYQEQVELPDWLLAGVDGNHLLAKLLWRRGIDSQQRLKEFLNPEEYTPTDPRQFPQLEEAVELVLSAVEAGEKIVVYGDYDVDGVTSTVILVTMLEAVGANVDYHIPDRFTEGYGMDQGVVEQLAEAGVGLIITCDCGISNYEEVALAKELGMKVLVTDHHDLPARLPEADLILTPKFLEAEHPAYNLPGAGMAYFLAQAVLETTGPKQLLKKLLDPLALAIVADVVPLHGENRYLLQKGLASLQATDWIGIEELCKVSGITPGQLTEEDIGFRIGPRINAVGRMASAGLAVELLLVTERTTAQNLAAKLDQINQQRKELSQQMELDAIKMVEEQEEIEPLVLYRPDWHQGIVGIGAGRLTEKFGVPTILLCDKRDGEGVVTGSGRSIPGIHLRDLLVECQDLLLGFGGHAGAAGLSLERENLEQFSNKLKGLLQAELDQLGHKRIIEVDAKLDFSQLDLELYQELMKLAPFGAGNPKPLFYSPDVEVIHSRSISDGKHLRLVLAQQGERRSAIWWRGQQEKLGAEIDLVYSLQINEWQGKRELQLVVEEVLQSQSGEVREGFDCEFEDYRNWQELGRKLPKLTEVLYYYEGVEEPAFTPAINRYQGQEAEVVVFLSCPPSLKVMQELLLKIRPQRVLLAYSDIELRAGKLFLRQLLGLVKRVITEQGGRVRIETLAGLTGEEEGTILAALKHLQAQGMIELEFVGPANILLKKGKKKKKNSPHQARLKSRLEESRAFRRYMLEQDLGVIKKLVMI